MLAYFGSHHGLIAINELSQALAAVAVIVFSAGLARTLGAAAAPQLIAAGAVAATTLFLSAALFSTLTLPELTDQPALGAVIYHLGYLIGGPAHVVALATLIGTTAISGRLSGKLPGWLSIAGVRDRRGRPAGRAQFRHAARARGVGHAVHPRRQIPRVPVHPGGRRRAATPVATHFPGPGRNPLALMHDPHLGRARAGP
jgi:hypothetical protein